MLAIDPAAALVSGLMQAQDQLIRGMVVETGRDRYTDLAIVNGRLYRVQIERLPATEVSASPRQFLEDHPDADT